MLTKTDITRLTQKMNDHYSLSPDMKDAVTEQVLADLSQTVRKRLRGMRPQMRTTIEIFVGECRV